MSGKTSFIAFLLLTLVLANAWSTGVVQDLAQGKLQTSSTPNHKWYQTPWGKVGYEGIGVIVAVALANASDEIASVVLVFAVGLWLLWLIQFTTKKGATTNGS